MGSSNFPRLFHSRLTSSGIYLCFLLFWADQDKCFSTIYIKNRPYFIGLSLQLRIFGPNEPLAHPLCQSGRSSGPKSAYVGMTIKTFTGFSFIFPTNNNILFVFGNAKPNLLPLLHSYSSSWPINYPSKGRYKKSVNHFELDIQSVGKWYLLL